MRYLRTSKLWGLGFVAVVFAIATFWCGVARSSFMQLDRFSQKIVVLEKHNARLEEAVVQGKVYLEQLNEDPEYARYVAKKSLGLVGDNEVVVYFDR